MGRSTPYPAALLRPERGSPAGRAYPGRSERLLDHLGEMAGVGVWEIDARSGEVYGNATTWSILGLPEGSQAEVLGLFSAADREELGTALARLIKDNAQLELEAEIATRGGPRWIRLTAAVQREGFAVARLVGGIQDIGKRKAADARFVKLLEGLPGPAAELDERMVLRVANRHVAEVLGLPLSSVAGQTLEAILPADAAARIRERVRSAFESSSSVSFEETLVLGGVQRTFMAMALRMSEPRRVVVMAFDVTEQRRGREAQRSSEARLRALVEAIPDSMMVFERSELVRPLDAIARRAWETGELQVHEHAQSRHVGKRTLETRVVPLDDTHILAIIRDITDRKEAERKLRLSLERQAKLLERVTTAQDDERRRIARELHDQTGSSLASMLVVCRLLQDASTLADARARAERLTSELETMMDEIGRLARGLHPIPLDELGLAPALTRLADTTAEGAGIEIDVEIDLEGTRLSPQTELTLFRIVQESLTNVVKHSGASHVGITCRRDREMVVLTVEDDGQGFDAGRMDTFFTDGRLGLVGIRDRADLIRAQLTIASAPGQGTKVEVHAPIDATPETAP